MKNKEKLIHSLKGFIAFLLGILVLTGLHTLPVTAGSEASEPEWEVQSILSTSVVRLHIIANSDSTRDQQLKLRLRDHLLDRTRACLSRAADSSQARELLAAQTEPLCQEAAAYLRSQGYDGPVRVTLGDRYFPAKTYGDLRFPAGIYPALCVEIGEAKGHNWWCVLFPTLCLVDDSHAEVPAQSKEKLRKNLNDFEYRSLLLDSVL